MTQPLGYYVSDPEDTDTIDEIAITYGSRLENLGPMQKSELVLSLAAEYSAGLELSASPQEIERFPTWLREQIPTMSSDSLLGLMSATIEQLRHTQ